MLKRGIRNLIHRLGYDISRRNTLETPRRPFSVLRYVVQEHIQHNPGFYFVQIGANDGVANDPIRPLVMEYHMKGLLVEPMPDFFIKLVKNYEGETQLQFENSAIGSSDGSVSLFRFRPGTPLPQTFYHGLARFDGRYMIERARKMGLGKYIEEIQVPSLTFNSLARKHGIKQVDLLQIDTEGFDYEIVKMAFAAGIFPEIINYEWTELSKLQQHDCKVMLVERGYRFVDIGPDVLCVRSLD